MLKQPGSEIKVVGVFKILCFGPRPKDANEKSHYFVSIKNGRNEVQISFGKTEKAALRQAKRRLQRHIRELDRMIEEEGE